VFCSHPVVESVSQSAKPESHVKPQLPAEQVGVVFVAVGQALLQAPQFADDVCVFVSQPSPASVLQSAKPTSHVPSAHVLALHVGVLCVVLHAPAHDPQWAGSLVKSPQSVPQRI
jgi:hypothetical protein